MKLNKTPLGQEDKKFVEDAVVERVSGYRQLMASYGFEAPTVQQTHQNNYTP
jgi:hypothetical protein